MYDGNIENLRSYRETNANAYSIEAFTRLALRPAQCDDENNQIKKRKRVNEMTA